MAGKDYHGGGMQFVTKGKDSELIISKDDRGQEQLSNPTKV